MKIIYVQTYPVYHDHLTDEQWLNIENRDKWMPAITAKHGVETEIWAVGRSRMDVEYRWMESKIPIRVFPTSCNDTRTKFHYSDALIDYARSLTDVHFVLKGVDGGVGLRLLDKVILPSKAGFSFIIGGKSFSKYHPFASMIFYESDLQKRQLIHPKWFFRKSVPNEKLFPLAKSVDLDTFKPLEEKNQKYDIVTLGRLIPYYKNYDAVFELAKKYKIAVIGGGPLLEQYRMKYTEIEWLGQISHEMVPSVLQQARLFLYTSKRDYYPRAIAEAISCGMPVAAFRNSISEDVVRPEFGVLMDDRSYMSDIGRLFGDTSKLDDMGRNARQFAESNLGKSSSTAAVKELIRRLS